MKRLSSLELFVLSCFDRGLETPYDLQRKAGLSLGATTPALKRLLKAGLLKKSIQNTATKRPRHHYSLTATGRGAARSGWKAYFAEPVPPNDTDSLLRVFDMAMHYGAGDDQLKQYLERASSSRSQLAQTLRLPSQAQLSGNFHYTGLRAKIEAGRVLSEVETLTELSSVISAAKKDKGTLARKRQLR
jgi:DNA-binding MarR family transcriptional regulator